ncbi:50S ribosomal protein L4 [archaeon]|jgi:large subunit ribosomal protein L4e|nr:50S ribosomal protein L4 [archaeon]MBT6697696.1 50S ribosomal protein L4 [archaeon]
MKVNIVDAMNASKGKLDLPEQFSEEVRSDLIVRLVVSEQSASRQPYGASPEAGLRHSSKLSKRRRKYRGCYGFGISRVNRKIHTRRGTRFHWVGAFSPQTRGGRRAHAPKTTKKWVQKINKKEANKAIRSAMAATMDAELVAERGHKIPANYPFILDNSFESLSKTKEVKSALDVLGFAEELVRGAKKTVRAGKGTMRGRRYKKRKSAVVVVSNLDCALAKAARNIAGVNVVSCDSLTGNILAPGTHVGRAALWTQAAIEKIGSEKLYM